MRLIISDTKRFGQSVRSLGSVVKTGDYFWRSSTADHSAMVEVDADGASLIGTNGKAVVRSEIPAVVIPNGTETVRVVINYAVLKNVVCGISYAEKSKGSSDPLLLENENILPFENVRDEVKVSECWKCKGVGININTYCQTSIRNHGKHRLDCWCSACEECEGTGENRTDVKMLGGEQLTGMKRVRKCKKRNIKAMGMAHLADDALMMEVTADKVEVKCGQFNATLHAKMKAEEFLKKG